VADGTIFERKGMQTAAILTDTFGRPGDAMELHYANYCQADQIYLDRDQHYLLIRSHLARKQALLPVYHAWKIQASRA